MPSAQGSNKVDNKLAKAAAVAKAVVSSETKEEQQPQTQQPQGASGGNKTPQEQPEFIKQALIIIEKKVRNLDKRRSKLEEYKADQKKGQVLNEDQLSAVSRYDEVIRTLELSRELEKQFVGLANDAMKQQKKQAKKEQAEREEAVKEKLKESQKMLALLDNFANDEIRADFLNEVNGATKLTQSDLDLLDNFSKIVQGFNLGNKLDQTASESADHLIALIDAKNKPVPQLAQVTYSDLRKLFDRIFSSPYWNREATVAKVEPVQKVEQIEQKTSELNLNENVQAPPAGLEQGGYSQQNTSDDFVFVSQNDLSENSAQQKMNSPPGQSQQQQPSKTFFTTLNSDLSTQFLNKADAGDEGINFLQDSEIQSRQQHEQLMQQQQDGFQGQVPQQNNQFGNYQEFSQNEGQKPRNSGGNRDFNGGNRNYQNRPRYSDERRSGGNGMPRHNSGGAQYNNNNGNSYNNRNSNGGGNFRGGNRGGFGGRGGMRGGGNSNGPRVNNYRQDAPMQAQDVQK